MPIAVEQLTSGSVISALQSEGGRIHRFSFAGAEGPQIEIARASDVLYVPSALDTGQSVQIWRGRVVPIEAVFDEFTPAFVKDRLLRRGVRTWTEFEPSPYEEDVCILGNVFSRNFTHWHEELMKVLLLEEFGSHCRYVISALPEFARELLHIVGVPPEQVLEVDTPTAFPSALYATPVSYRNLSDYPAVLYALREAMFSADELTGRSYPSRVWLERGEQIRLGRKLVNTEEVYGCLEKYEVARVDLGALPVRSQIAVARKAELLCGVHGSQFVHSQLMDPRSKVAECFSPLYVNPTYTEIYRVLRHRYSQICAPNTPVLPYAHGQDVYVDCQQLELALSQFCEQ